uniref:CSON013584 protein n=1 Tax=Culicoides sonorensis TaxID=179676 RepID=A0A336MKK3_CULSO
MDQISKVQKVLFSCSSLDQIDFEEIAQNLTWDQQKDFLDRTALHPLLVRYPIKRTFLLKFLKQLIEAIEKYSDEVHDDLYDYFCEIKVPLTSPEEFAFKHFMYNDQGDCVTIKEATSLISNGTTGLCTWEAAIKLAEYASQHKDEFEDKNMIELGSGIGFAGICIEKICKPKCLYLTDCHEKVLKLLRENVEINCEEQSNIKVKELFWGESLQEAINGDLMPDYLVASDIIYDDSLFEPLLKTVSDIFRLNSKCVFILACTIRNEETLNKFLTRIKNCEQKLKIIEETLLETSKFDLLNPNYKSKVKIYRILL